MYPALLLDVGHVILDISPAAIGAYDAAMGRTATSTGPLGVKPERDPEQWDEVARSRGFDGASALFRALATVVPDKLIDPDAFSLMRDARAAGRRVGTLSNDAYTFLGREFFTGRPEFAGLDAFVDSVDVGVRKPAPKAYLAAADALGVELGDVVFLDDTPECVEGARQVGMVGILVDPVDRTPAFAQARSLLGLPRRTAKSRQ
jgi:FMN phosphatase YigB (HAD superfamily)